MIRRPRLAGSLLAAILCVAVAAAPAPPLPQNAPAAPPPPSPKDVVITLYGADGLRSSLDLDRGIHGSRMVEGALVLDECELAFGLFEPGQLSYGFRRDEQALLVSLGNRKVEATTANRDVAPRPSVSVYHTLRLLNGKVVFTQPVGRTNRLNEAQAILGKYPVQGARHVTPQAGNVYLLRVRKPKAVGGGERIYKLLVLEANERLVTLRAAPLPAS